MKALGLKIFLLSFSVILLTAFDLPANWFKAGSMPDSYSMGIDPGSGKDGKNAATIKSIKKKINGFGTLMQMCAAKKYEGKRVKMTGMLKTENAEEWAGLWLRVDGENGSLAFDNMHDGKTDRSVKGTTDWQEYSIVLDVPQGASGLAFGALLVGKGQLWFDNIRFEIVDNSVATTGKEETSEYEQEEPMNLDFDK